MASSGRRSWICSLVAAVFVAGSRAVAVQTTGAGSPPAQPLHWVATEHIGRLTASLTNPIAPLGLAGTDLGVSFEACGKLVFLFGDSWTTDKRDWDADSVAWTKLAPLPSSGVPALEWAKRTGGRFLPLAPMGVELGGMNVPIEGFAVGDRTYVFFDRGWNMKAGRHTRSLLAHTSGLEFAKLELDHDVESESFINVSVVQEGADLWIFGSGNYRKSAIYLARVPVCDVADRGAWRYAPSFGAGEASAQPLVATDCVGELSVRRDPRSGIWFMAYNIDERRGIALRTARAPTGPWSSPIMLFDPVRDRGYGVFMHDMSSAVGFDDGLSERGREEEWACEYGPYLVPSWFEVPAPGVVALVYAMSTWNPYQVHMLRTWVAEAGVEWTPPVRARVASASAKALVNARFERGRLDGWTATGDAFATRERLDDSWELTTYVDPAGDAVTGTLAQSITVPADASELRCVLCGGTESIRLVRQGEIVRESRGPGTNDADRIVRWRIEDYRGEMLTIEIVDESKAPWGFLTVRGIELVP